MKNIGIGLLLALSAGLSGCSSTEAELDGVSIEVAEGFNHHLYQEALEEIQEKELKAPKYLALVDFGSPSEVERLAVVNLETDRVVMTSLVAHAKKSGFRIPYDFSNQKGSNKSSLGLYVTNETYDGKNGYSLRISGVSNGMNTNARDRFIVVHGSTYASYKHIEEFGMLGRSKGCFALPFNKSDEVINLLKGCGVIYAGR